MTPPATDELLRLARKAFPSRPEMGEDERDVPGNIEETPYGLELSSEYGTAIIEFRQNRPRNREALHAALLVLAGELDVAALLAELDRLREQIAARDVCEACGDCLMPQRPRCERHVNTEPGDPEWTL